MLEPMNFTAGDDVHRFRGSGACFLHRNIVVTGTTEEDTAATVISSLRRELSN